jgi:hypothetical protein
MSSTFGFIKLKSAGRYCVLITPFVFSMVVFKRCFLAFVVLVVSAGPTVAVHATGHHHASHARIAHNQRNKSLSRLSESSQEPGDSETTTAPTGNSQDQPTLNEPLSTPETETEGLTLSTFSSSRAVSTTEAGLALLIPNGIKAGVAGGDAYNILRDHIGWWYDWTPSPSKPGKPIGVPMLWGDGHADSTDAKRLKQFERLSSSSSGRMGHPKYVLGYEEPDCGVGSGSSGIGVEGGVREWERLIGPLKKRGTKVGSPSMCSESSFTAMVNNNNNNQIVEQADETWLKEFAKRIETPWDFTAIHVNKNNIDGVKKDIVSRVAPP